VELVARGLANSRQRAQALIGTGVVRLNDQPATAADQAVAAADRLEVLARGRFVGRGGEKLAGALAGLGVNPAGRVCLDSGASTGGFTDALLQAGAAHVYAVDVGYGQLDWALRQDPRVTVMERTNIRGLTELPGPAPDLAVADLSFISLRKVVPAIAGLLLAGGDMLLLVKPQFELGPGRVGRGGVVRDAADRREAVDTFTAWAADAGFEVLGQADSQIKGAKGNQETFVHLRLRP
jgi:23S rRNA (cytidine1920-2'-O)/16S rRNA (cytidine1409-2'-O)-methyltransferase